MKSRFFSKITVVLTAAIIAVCSLFSLVGCAPAGDEVVNLSLNPQIELIVDNEDKVISVSALNDEGNVVIANATFVGLSVEDAVNLFIKTTDESGFMIQGEVSSNENKLEIAISGSDAKALFNKVKSAAQTYLEENELTVNFSFEGQLDLKYIKGLVEEARLELSQAEINAMSKEELMDVLKQSREETKEFFSQEIKDLYYRLRETEYHKAKINKLIELLGQAEGTWATVVSNLQAKVEELATKTNEFVTKYTEQFLSETSEYQEKVVAFVNAKKALLEARLQGTATTVMEMTASAAESSLALAKSFAETAVATVQGGLNLALSTLETALEAVVNFISDNTAAIDSAIASAQTEFKTAFETEYSEFINGGAWQNLVQGDSAE